MLSRGTHRVSIRLLAVRGRAVAVVAADGMCGLGTQLHAGPTGSATLLTADATVSAGTFGCS
jgi:hypothetical protein